MQLPINAGMREGWEQPWQAIRPEGQPAGAAASLKLPAVEAAARLGLGVFASGPLGEGSLLEDKQLLVLRSSSLYTLITSSYTGRVSSECLIGGSTTMTMLVPSFSYPSIKSLEK